MICDRVMESYVKPGHIHVCINELEHDPDAHVCECGSGFGIL